MQGTRGTTWMKVRDFFARISGNTGFGKVDLGILMTLMRLAAVDGRIDDDEIAFFKDAAERCRGYSGEAFEDLWKNALRSAGYLMLQARYLNREQIVATFISETENGFVKEIKFESPAEWERAFACLDEMAAADGERSEIESACIAALVKRAKAAREQAIAEWYSRATLYDSDKKSDKTA